MSSALVTYLPRVDDKTLCVQPLVKFAKVPLGVVWVLVRRNDGPLLRGVEVGFEPESFHPCLHDFLVSWL